MKIVSVGDIHCRVGTDTLIKQILGELDHAFDVLLLAGDLTDTGLPEEAEVLVKQLMVYHIPIIAVLGNHDHESDQQQGIVHVLEDAGITVLDRTACKVDSIGFVGTKGFCGGFGQNLVQPFGEAALKTFIRASIDEAAQLEAALESVQECAHKVVLLHYAPVPETLEGEPHELFAFLGTSRLASAIDPHGADVILHGHAHHGAPMGRTPGNIPVYNVSRFVQMAHTGKPYCVIEL